MSQPFQFFSRLFFLPEQSNPGLWRTVTRVSLQDARTLPDGIKPYFSELLYIVQFLVDQHRHQHQ